jgi:hypothetical protein
LVALIVPEIEAVNRLRNGDVQQAIREAVGERVQAVPSYQDQRLCHHQQRYRALIWAKSGSTSWSRITGRPSGGHRDDTSAGPVA